MEFVEIATDYLEDALSSPDRQRFEAHLAACDGCDVYFDQLKETAKLVGRLHESNLSPEARAVLLDAFRSWKQGD
jgi:anti-sigma factor RsiW